MNPGPAEPEADMLPSEPARRATCKSRNEKKTRLCITLQTEGGKHGYRPISVTIIQIMSNGLATPIAVDGTAIQYVYLGQLISYDCSSEKEIK